MSKDLEHLVSMFASDSERVAYTKDRCVVVEEVEEVEDEEEESPRRILSRLHRGEIEQFGKQRVIERGCPQFALCGILDR